VQRVTTEKHERDTATAPDGLMEKRNNIPTRLLAAHTHADDPHHGGASTAQLERARSWSHRFG